jgi:hypothetical protein
MLLKPGRSPRIFGAIGMLAPIYLDHEAILNRREINNEGADWPLSAKLVSGQPAIAQYPPQPTLGIG